MRIRPPWATSFPCVKCDSVFHAQAQDALFIYCALLMLIRCLSSMSSIYGFFFKCVSCSQAYIYFQLFLGKFFFLLVESNRV